LQQGYSLWFIFIVEKGRARDFMRSELLGVVKDKDPSHFDFLLRSRPFLCGAIIDYS